MSLIKQLIPTQLKFTPASSEVNWQYVNTLVHGPGAGEDHRTYNSAVFACLMTIASAYPEPPLTVMKRKADGKSEKVEDHPMQLLLDDPTPNGELSIDEIQFWTAWALHVDGNAYWLKVRSGNKDTGNVVELWPISPTLMKPHTEPPDKAGNQDWISYYKYQKAPGIVVPIPVKNVIHYRLGLDDRDMRLGLAPLKHLARSISTDDEADKFIDVLLKNYAVPGLVVIPGGGINISQDDADVLAGKLSRKFGSDNRGNIAVMSKEVTVEQFGFSPKDLDMSILHRIPEERISAVMGVPAIVAGLGAGLDRATYANFKEAREMFTESKLVPQWRANARKLDTSLKRDFTRDKNIYIENDLSNVRTLQEDEDNKYKRLSVAVGKPFIKRNEARTDVGLDPIPEWDTEDAAPPEPVPPQLVEEQPQQNNGSNNADEQEQEEQTPKAVALGKWQKKALRAARGGQGAAVKFESEHIPASQAEAISKELADCKTADEIVAVFASHMKAAKPMDVLDALLFEMARANALMEKAG